MDVGTILGILVGFSLVGIAIGTGGGLSWFIHGPSAMIVLGGTLGALLINYPLRDVLGVLKVSKNVFFRQRHNIPQTIGLIVEYSRHARRNGILSLQHLLDKGGVDPFFRKAVELLVDGLEPAELKGIINTELESLEERHRLGADMFTTMGNFAPAMGMVGTLIGLVKMLMFMDDPARIGPAMALALVTTFYGVLLANLVFLPMAGKLRNRSAEEILVKQLIREGILAIQEGENPRIIEQKLNSFLSPGERKRP